MSEVAVASWQPCLTGTSTCIRCFHEALGGSVLYEDPIQLWSHDRFGGDVNLGRLVGLVDDVVAASHVCFSPGWVTATSVPWMSPTVQIFH